MRDLGQNKPKAVFFQTEPRRGISWLVIYSLFNTAFVITTLCLFGLNVGSARAEFEDEYDTDAQTIPEVVEMMSRDLHNINDALYPPGTRYKSAPPMSDDEPSGNTGVVCPLDVTVPLSIAQQNTDYYKIRLAKASKASHNCPDSTRTYLRAKLKNTESLLLGRTSLKQTEIWSLAEKLVPRTGAIHNAVAAQDKGCMIQRDLIKILKAKGADFGTPETSPFFSDQRSVCKDFYLPGQTPRGRKDPRLDPQGWDVLENANADPRPQGKKYRWNGSLAASGGRGLVKLKVRGQKAGDLSSGSIVGISGYPTQDFIAVPIVPGQPPIETLSKLDGVVYFDHPGSNRPRTNARGHVALHLGDGAGKTLDNRKESTLASWKQRGYEPTVMIFHKSWNGSLEPTSWSPEEDRKQRDPQPHPVFMGKR